MEEPKIEDLMNLIKNKEIKRTEPYKPELWYNAFGDCIEFQTEDVAIVADRVDNFLTIYRSIETSMPIGFQLKDVKALMEKHNCDLSIIKANILNKQLMSVAAILIKAYEEKPVTIRKEEGYREALENLFKKAGASVCD